MKLITEALKKRFKEVGDQSLEQDPIIVAKWFNPTGGGTWYATEYDSETKIAYGYVELMYNEWGSFSISELENVIVPPFGLKIERDIHFSEKHFSELMKEKNRIHGLQQTKDKDKDKEAQKGHEI